MRKFLNTVKEIGEGLFYLASGSSLCGVMLGAGAFISGATPEQVMSTIFGWSVLTFFGASALAGLVKLDIILSTRHDRAIATI